MTVPGADCPECDARLTEHGTSVHCGWLTDLGRAVLAALRKHGPDPDAWDTDTARSRSGRPSLPLPSPR